MPDLLSFGFQLSNTQQLQLAFMLSLDILLYCSVHIVVIAFSAVSFQTQMTRNVPLDVEHFHSQLSSPQPKPLLFTHLLSIWLGLALLLLLLLQMLL